MLKNKEEFLNKLEVIEKKLGYIFKDKELLLQAFTHASFYNEHKELMSGHNERLEFLGDSVLGLILSEYFFLSKPGLSEGEL